VNRPSLRFVAVNYQLRTIYNNDGSHQIRITNFILSSIGRKNICVTHWLIDEYQQRLNRIVFGKIFKCVNDYSRRCGQLVLAVNLQKKKQTNECLQALGWSWNEGKHNSASKFNENNGKTGQKKIDRPAKATLALRIIESSFW